MGGGGNTYDYGFRIYNPSLARFLSVDPLFTSYPWYTPYQFSGNNPIEYIDLDGLEQKEVKTKPYTTKPNLKVGDEVTEDGKIYKVTAIVMGTNAFFYSGYSGSWDRAGRNMGTQQDANALPFPYNTNGEHDIPLAYVIDFLDAGFADPRIIGQQGDAVPSKIRLKVYVNTTYNVVLEHNPPPVPEEKGEEIVPKKNKPVDTKGKGKSKPDPDTQPKTDTEPKTIPPPTPVPDPEASMCFDCFQGTYMTHWTTGVQAIVDWLKNNPDYNLVITADGGSSTWVTDTWDDKPVNNKYTTYRQFTQRRFVILKNAVNAAGGDASRITQQLGNADGENLQYSSAPITPNPQK